jgi:hypothetical protein
MSKIDPTKMVDLVKEANDLIKELETHSQELATKLANLESENAKGLDEIPALVNKLASITDADGSPLIAEQVKDKFIAGLAKRANLISVLNDMADRFGALSKKAKENRSEELGGPAHHKQASIHVNSTSEIYKLSHGRVSM